MHGQQSIKIIILLPGMLQEEFFVQNASKQRKFMNHKYLYIMFSIYVRNQLN